jgi:hypothetical protein
MNFLQRYSSLWDNPILLKEIRGRFRNTRFFSHSCRFFNASFRCFIYWNFYSFEYAV